jgi:hypothetical protein
MIGLIRAKRPSYSQPLILVNSVVFSCSSVFICCSQFGIDDSFIDDAANASRTGGSLGAGVIKCVSINS